MNKTSDILLKYIPSNMKRKTLAEILEVKPQYLSNVLNDSKKASNVFLNKFYSLFNVSDEDIDKIEKYEVFRKVPKDIRNEVLEIKKGFTNFETIYLENMGILTDDEFLISNDAEIMSIKKGILYEQMMKGDFFITVNTDRYSPFFKEDILIFKKISLNIEANGKYCLVKYKNKIDMYLIKIIDKKIVLNSLVKNGKNYILTRNKDLKIYGYVYSSIVRRVYE